METYAFPVIGKKTVDEIEPSDVLAVLEPIWTVKYETATRVKQRIGAVMDWAGYVAETADSHHLKGVDEWPLAQRGLHSKIGQATDSCEMPASLLPAKAWKPTAHKGYALIGSVGLECLLACKAHSANEIMAAASESGMNPVIPRHRRPQTKRQCGRVLYRLATPLAGDSLPWSGRAFGQTRILDVWNGDYSDKTRGAIEHHYPHVIGKSRRQAR